MAKRTVDELLEAARALLPGTEDNVLAFFEDISDSYTPSDTTDVERLQQELNTVKQEKIDLDNQWRNKYRERFTHGPSEEEEELLTGDPEPKPLTFENLFKQE